MIPICVFLTVGVTVPIGMLVGKIPLANAGLEGINIGEDCTNIMSVRFKLEFAKTHTW
jgi:hypothetical protein